MTLTMHLVLVVLALISFFVAALSVPSRVNLTAAGLFLLTLAYLLAGR